MLRRFKRETDSLLDACQKGNFEQVQNLLLDSDLDLNVNSAITIKRNPMYCAVVNNQINIVRLLINFGANVDVEFKHGDCSLLHLASKKGLTDIVKVFLENNADTERENVFGDTAVFLAARNGHLDAVKILLDYGAKIKIRNNFNLLHEGCSHGHSEIARYLLDNQVDIECVDGADWTPLFHAVYRGHAETVRLLAHYGANVQVTIDGYQPLHIASIHGYKDIVEILLANKADIDCRDESDWTPLFYACHKGRTETVKTLLRYGAEVNITVNESTPLNEAVEQGHYEIVKILIENNAVVDCKGGLKWTPLFLAVRNGRTEIAKLLVNCGSNVKISVNGRTPLHNACEEGNLEMVKLFLQNKADVNAEIQLKKTPLFFAVCNGHTEVVKLLLQSGANRNIEVDGFTLLHHSCKNGFMKIVRLLLDKKTDVEYKNRLGETPLFIATSNRHAGIVKILLNHRALIDETVNGNTALHQAILYGYEDIVKILIEHKANVELKNSMGETPLFLAARYGRASAVQMLLEYKAGVDVKVHGRTPLHEAIIKGYQSPKEKLIVKDYTDIIQKLLVNNADKECVSNSGETPLTIASRLGFLDAVKVLVSYRANINNGLHVYPLHAAVIEGHKDVVEYLLQNKANPSILSHTGKKAPTDITNDSEILKLLILYGAKCYEELNREAYIMKHNFLKEVHKMKSTKIDEIHNIHHIFFMNPVQLSKIVNNNGALKNMYASIDGFKKNSFNHYVDLLKKQFESGMKKGDLIESASYSLANLIQMKVPSKCCYNIFKDLNDIDLNNLVDSAINITDNKRSDFKSQTPVRLRRL